MSNQVNESLVDSFDQSMHISSRGIAVLTTPHLLQYLDFEVLKHYKLICKTIKLSVADNDLGQEYWKALCGSFAFHFGLYIPDPTKVLDAFAYRKYFIQDLWCLRHKWNNREAPTQDFRIRVSCRFRPGERGDKALCLPLHQYLKVKRQQKLKDQENVLEVTPNQSSGILVGDVDPDEFLDPLLGTLMREPVLLTSSNRIVDRSVAVQAVLRGSRDPFNGSKLSLSMLIPQPELTQRISDWKAKKLQREYTLGIQEVQELISESAVDPKLLQTLIEIERLAQDAQRVDTHNDSNINRRRQRDHDEMDLPATTVIDAEDLPSAVTDELTMNNDIVQNNHPEAMDAVHHTVVPSHASSSIVSKADRARLVDINQATASVAMNLPGSGIRSFQFLSVHDGSTSQYGIYEACGKDMVVATLNGFNACVLCYGQTGSGKTHTFFGADDALYEDMMSDGSSNCNPSTGIVVRSCLELLHAKATMEAHGIHINISSQFIEIYDEQVIDLLSDADDHHIAIRRDNGEIVGAVEVAIHDIDSMFTTLRLGHTRKRFARTAMNDRSSRSHTAFILYIAQTNAALSDQLIKTKLHLIDLAGSERVKKSEAVGQQLREAVGINYSLLVLGKVISSLTTQASHVPYFESKLTTMLKAAFGGNSRTCAIVNSRPEDKHGDETLQSLRFGERCSMISNNVRAAATSLENALHVIDDAVLLIEKQISGLEGRGRAHLDPCRRLVESLSHMKKKRELLITEKGSRRRM